MDLFYLPDIPFSKGPDPQPEAPAPDEDTTSPAPDTPEPVDLNDIDTLVLCGGGVYGVSYLGVLESFFREKGLDIIATGRHITTICGVSVGALLGLFLACGFQTFEKIHELLDELMASSLAVLDPFQIGKSWGLNNGRRMRQFLRSFVDTRLGTTVRTFLELRQATGVSLHLHATNLNRCVPHLFSPVDTPDADVVEAVYASMAVPMFFAPSLVFGPVLADGGLLSNVPFVPDRKQHSSLVLRAFCDPEGDINDIPSFVSQVVEAGLRARTEREWEQMPPVMRRRTVPINCGCVSAFNFDLKVLDKKKLLLKGLEAADRFYEQQPVHPRSRFRTVGTQTTPP